MGLAWALARAAGTFQTRSLTEAHNAIDPLLRQAEALGGGNAEVRVGLAWMLWQRGDHQGAIDEAERALAISPNLAGAHHQFGAALIFSGQHQQGISAVRTSLRLDPLSPSAPGRLNHIALGFYFAGDYEAAAEGARQAIRSFPAFPQPYRWLAASLGQLGQSEEAKEALEKAIAIAPASFDMYVGNRVPWMLTEDHAHMVEGLRKAGWTG